MNLIGISAQNSPAWNMGALSPEANIFPDNQDMPIPVPFGELESGSDEDYSVQTPEQKPAAQKGFSLDHISETPLSSGNESSDISAKEGSETMSSSSSSSDAESVTYVPRERHSVNHVNGGEVLQPKFMELEEDDNLDSKENLPMVKEDEEGMAQNKGMNYEELLKMVANYELELKSTKKKLQASQEEVSKLKYENWTLVEELGSTTEKLRTNMKEMEINLRNELQESQGRLKEKLDLANQSIDDLQAELASERQRGSELQEMIARTTNDLSDYSHEVEELKLALYDAQKEFFKDKLQSQSNISCLHEQNEALQVRLNEAEMRQRSLEDRIQQYEVEKTERGKSNEAREAAMQDEIGQLHMDLYQKTELIDKLNKDLDASKLKFDMVMAEKDEMFAKLEILGAEISCRNISIQQMEERISKFVAEHEELIAKSQKTQKLVEELRLTVTNQEQELEQQQVSLSDRAQEKREAIRQLCYSLEYYRNEYHELRLAIMKHNLRPAAVLAS